MKLFRRKPQPIVQPEPETVKTVDPVYHCCNCNAVTGFEHRFVNGDLYLKRLQFNFLCDECYVLREQARTRHNVANHHTVLEHQAVTKRPRKIALEA